MFANISNYLDYREVIKIFSKNRGILFKNLAESSNVHTSYFSRVMKGDADFSPDQLFLIGKDLGLVDWELDYFLLLGEYTRSGNYTRKQYLKKRISTIQKQRQKVIGKLKKVYTEFSEQDISIYYQEVITAQVHMCLTMQKFRNKPMLISGKLDISERKLKRELKKLESLNIISFKDDTIVLNASRVHLDSTHPISNRNHINWRLEVISYLTKQDPRPSDYNFSATFSSDEKTKIKIKEMFKEFVVEAQKEVSKHKKVEDTYFIGFDLF